MNLGMYIDELLEVVTEELTNEELLEIEQEHIADGGKRKGNCRRKTEEPTRKFIVKV